MKIVDQIKNLKRFLDRKHQTIFLDYKVDQKPRHGHGKPAHEILLSILTRQINNYESHITEIINNEEHLIRLQQNLEGYGFKFSWNNGFFPGLDIASLYTMVSVYKPNNFIEVGSGYSTMIAYQSIKDHGINTSIISIDPLPRVDIKKISTRTIEQPLENIDLQIFESLEENDILFIDNSHRILPNSDCTVFFLEILPRLKKGVIVHIHDIYIPYDYPQFMCDRSYSEQYGLAIALLNNPAKYDIIAPNYFISQDESMSTMSVQLWRNGNLRSAEKHGGSFWLRIAS